jgi:glycosyltransferase involved in cell wall biosynthesis
MLNNASTVAEAVSSVLAQTMGDFELLALDNGSTDATNAIVDGFRDPRIRVITDTRAMSFEDCQNEGARLASGVYLARLDADDRCYPDRLSRQVAAIKDDRQAGVVVGGAKFVSRTGTAFAYREPPRGHAGLWLKLLFGNCIINPSSMMRSDLFLAVGGFRSGYALAEDYDLWLRLAAVTRFVTIRGPIIDYRIHGNNASLRRAAEQRSSAKKARSVALRSLIEESCESVRYSFVEEPIRNRSDLRSALNEIEICRSAVAAHCRERQIGVEGLKQVSAQLIWQSGGHRFREQMAVLAFRHPSFAYGLVRHKLTNRDYGANFSATTGPTMA